MCWISPTRQNQGLPFWCCEELLCFEDMAGAWGPNQRGGSHSSHGEPAPAGLRQAATMYASDFVHVWRTMWNVRCSTLTPLKQMWRALCVLHGNRCGGTPKATCDWGWVQIYSMVEVCAWGNIPCFLFCSLIMPWQKGFHYNLLWPPPHQKTKHQKSVRKTAASIRVRYKRWRYKNRLRYKRGRFPGK